MSTRRTRKGASAVGNRADAAYAHIKREIAEFRRVPGERFSEAEIAQELGMSRTPVREALYRLEREGYVTVSERSGWTLKPFDFKLFDDLYDVRLVLEAAAIRKLCESETMPELSELTAVWLVPREQWLTDGTRVSELDERFHAALVAAAGNEELARIHREVTERIRIVRRLDFTKPERIRTTYQEHAQILRQVLRRKAEEAIMLIRSHIAASKAEVHKITLHMLYMAREEHASVGKSSVRAARRA